MSDKNPAGKERLHAVVQGVVQGVSFRYYTRQRARALGITGWVTNCRDGTVQVTAEGAHQVLETFVAWLHHGPPLARVDQVQVTWTDAAGEFERFDILATDRW
jgi:acylphosphatase